MSLDSIKQRINALENSIQQSIQNHTSLMVALNEAKHCLQIAAEVSEVVSPESEATHVISEAAEVANSLQ